MIIAPVIFLTVATGIAGMSDMKKVGCVAGKAMLYFLTFSTLALVVGLVVANVVQPSSRMDIDPATVADYAAKAHDSTIVGFLINIIPKTLVGAFAEGDILQVLFIPVLLGITLATTGERGQPIFDFMQGLTYPIFKLVAILMKVAPVGAFTAMAITIGKYGIESVVNIAFLVLCFYLTAFLFVAVILGAVKGMALILGVDRFMSEVRALTNFIGNAVATLVVARWENELDMEALQAALNGHPRDLAQPSAQPDLPPAFKDDVLAAD